MKELFLAIFFSTLFVSSFPQSESKSDCNKLRAKGYTENFCQYDNKYSFKKIPLESSFDFVSSHLKLTKREDNPNEYNCKDDSIRYWANTKFDNCIFGFSSDKTLEGIQLQIEGHGNSYVSNDVAIFSSLNNYLTTLFGKPKDFSGMSCWIGNKLSIALSRPSNGSGIVVAIFKSNINPLDNL